MLFSDFCLLLYIKNIYAIMYKIENKNSRRKQCTCCFYGSGGYPVRNVVSLTGRKRKGTGETVDRIWYQEIWNTGSYGE